MAVSKNLAENPFERLANAVVLQAASDYREALKRMKKDPGNMMASGEVENLERFFCSGWYQALTAVNGEYLIRRLREKAGM
jgi:hypothetical protein